MFFAFTRREKAWNDSSLAKEYQGTPSMDTRQPLSQEKPYDKLN